MKQIAGYLEAHADIFNILDMCARVKKEFEPSTVTQVQIIFIWLKVYKTNETPMNKGIQTICS